MKIILKEGDTLSEENVENMREYLNSTENEHFEFNKGKWKVGIVGYLNFKVEEINYKIYCFPKNYVVKNENLEMKQVIDVLRKANFNANGIESDERVKYGSVFTSFKKVEEYYFNFGIYNYKEIYQKKGKSGKINWRKTINKQRSLINNENIIFNNYYLDNKQTIRDFLSNTMKYVLNIAHEFFPFYFNKYSFIINSGEMYKKNKIILSKLIEQRKYIFGDKNVILLENLINIFSEFEKNFLVGLQIFTRKFDLIWEEMIAKISGKFFRHKVKYFIDDYKKMSIELDHLNEKEKIIMDSKYYLNIEKRKNEYKQYFYGYHLKTINDCD